MKSFVRTISGMVLVAAIAGCTPQVTILVPDMMCEEGCAATVHDLLVEQPGVKRVEVDFPARMAIVSIDTDQDAEPFSPDAAVAVLVDHGFDRSRLIKSDAPQAETTDL